MRFPRLWLQRLAIDLGTANTRVYVRGEGIVVDEPSVVAVAKKRAGRPLDIIAVGNEAKRMIGRTPADSQALRPIHAGVIGDFDAAREMIRHFIRSANGGRRLMLQRVVVAAPRGSTSIERRALREAATSAGAGKVFLLDQAVGAGLGAGLPVLGAVGAMVVNIGAGTTDCAVVSLGATVTCQSAKVGGDLMDEMIVEYFRRHRNLAIALDVAETVKMTIGTASPSRNGTGKVLNVSGLDCARGMPSTVQVTEAEIARILAGPLSTIAETISTTLETVPPELSADIGDHGLVLTGGGSQLHGISRYLAQRTGVACTVVQDPGLAVVKGCGAWLDAVGAEESSCVLPTTRGRVLAGAG